MLSFSAYSSSTSHTMQTEVALCMQHGSGATLAGPSPTPPQSPRRPEQNNWCICSLDRTRTTLTPMYGVRNGRRPFGLDKQWAWSTPQSFAVDLLEADKSGELRSGTNVSFNVSAKSPTNCVNAHESLARVWLPPPPCPCIVPAFD